MGSLEHPGRERPNAPGILIWGLFSEVQDYRPAAELAQPALIDAARLFTTGLGLGWLPAPARPSLRR